jgi:hypothetical protein
LGNQLVEWVTNERTETTEKQGGQNATINTIKKLDNRKEHRGLLHGEQFHGSPVGQRWQASRGEVAKRALPCCHQRLQGLFEPV